MLIAMAVLFITQNCYSQNTKEWFSTPGLVIGSYGVNFGSPDPFYVTSVDYLKDTILCDKEFLVWRSLSNTQNIKLMHIDGNKVYEHTNWDPCAEGKFLYDFDMELGDTYELQGWSTLVLTVTDKGETFLLNGETRPFIKLEEIGSPYPVEVYWINGIGDVKNTLFHSLLQPEGGDSFGCARVGDIDLWAAPETQVTCDSLVCPTVRAEFSVASEDLTATFVNQSTDADTYTWDFGDGNTSNEQHPNHIYDEPGCYTVSLTVTSPCNDLTSKFESTTPVCIAPDWLVEDHPSEELVMTDFIDDNTGWATSNYSIHKTEDGGQTWTEQTIPDLIDATGSRRVQAIEMWDENRGVIACFVSGADDEDGAILMTSDGGETWESRLPGGRPVRTFETGEDGSAFGQGQYTDLYYSPDFGQSWEEIPLVGYMSIRGMHYLGEDVMHAVFFNNSPSFQWFFAKTQDHGINWSVEPFPMPDDEFSGPTCVHFRDQAEGFVGGYLGKFLYTTNGGASWSDIPYPGDGRVTAIEFANDLVGWATGYEGLILRTTDGGMSWEPQNCGSNENVTKVSVVSESAAFLGRAGEILRYQEPQPLECASNTSAGSIDHSYQLSVSPNPASASIQVSLENSFSLLPNDRLVIMDITGRILSFQDQLYDENLIDVSFMHDGLYRIHLLRDGLVIAQESFVVVR